MPSCPPTCPIVKRELKKRAAERQKALQAGLSPSDKNEEEETSEDKIPDEEPSPADFAFGDKELESDHDSQENERRAEDEARRIEDDASNEEKSSRNARSGGSERRSSGYSGRDLSRRSSKSRNGDGRRKFRDGSIGSERSRSKPEQTRKGDHAEYESDRSEYCDPSQDNPCSSECFSRRLKEKMMRRKLAKQKALDGGMNYFKDLCNCSFTCLFKQLWNDPFIGKMLRSAALFAVGIKLCWEMDAWYIPTPSII